MNKNQITNKELAEFDLAISREIGLVLCNLRHKMGLKQIDVESDLDLSERVLSLYERGKKHFSVGTIVMFAQYYDVPIQELLRPVLNSAPSSDPMIAILATLLPGYPPKDLTFLLANVAHGWELHHPGQTVEETFPDLFPEELMHILKSMR